MKKLLLIPLILFFACAKKEPKYKYHQKIVINKVKSLRRGNTTFEIAFNDGTSEVVDFGLYSLYNIGDTACFEQNITSFPGALYFINCN